MANGNGWVRPVLIGVAIFVLGSVIIGSGTTTIANTVARRGIEVQLNTNTKEIVKQEAAVAKIPVMAEQIKDVKEDVTEVLRILRKK